MNYRIGLLTLLAFTLFCCNQHIKFNSDQWKKSGGENIMLDTRLSMAKDLIESEILLNKSSIEIVELLGSSTRFHGNEIKNAKYFAVQELYGWDIDPEEMTFIKVQFNDNGTSIFVELYSTK